MPNFSDAKFGYNIGLEAAHLSLGREGVFFDKTARSEQKIDQISTDLHIILKLLSSIRREKELQEGDMVDLNHLREELDQFAEIWERCAHDYASIREEENPFPQGMDVSNVSKRDLEWIESTIRNLETRHQGSIQREMVAYETETMAHKQIMEILVQIAKIVRESSGYYTKQAGR